MKKLFAFLLALTLMLSLAACGGAPQSTTSAGGSTSAPKDIQKLVMTFVVWTGAPADTEVVQEKINEILREKLGAEIDMQIYDVGSYKQSMTLALAGGEQIDIMNGITLGYPSLVSQGYLLDLEENGLLDTYGQGITDAVGADFVDACRIDGVLYGLPNNRDMAVGRGCIAIRTDCLEAVGWTAPENAPEIIPATQEEVDDLLAKIHEAFPDMETYRPTATNNLVQYSDVDQLGGNFFGVLLDYGKELKVENLFTSDAYMEYCQMMYDWNQKGYISQDAATDTTAVTALVTANTLASYTTGGKPGSKAQESSRGVDMTILQTKSDFLQSNAVASFPWCIPINTANAELAMQVLNEFYTNPELSELLIYGIEGEHFEVVDGCARTILDANGNSRYATLGWEAPNQFITYPIAGNPTDLWEQTREFNNNALQSAACGFTFDATNVATEMAAVQNVYDEYLKSVEFGFVDPAVAIPEMNEKMMAAGLQKIIDEKQAQLDAWAAIN